MIRNYPEKTIQYYFDPWWEKDNNNEVCRGSLIKTFLPHVDQITQQFILKGRTEATKHNEANFHIKPFNIRQRRDKATLPVAAFPLYDGEIYTIHRSKSRYAIVLSCGGIKVSEELRIKHPKWQTAHKLIVAPYYGVKNTNKRAGFSNMLVNRIKEAWYPQFFWDKLPTSNTNNESIMKLNHLQPAGEHYQTYEKTGFKLSKQALNIIDIWLDWFLNGALIKDSDLFDFKQLMIKNNKS